MELKHVSFIIQKAPEIDINMIISYRYTAVHCPVLTHYRSKTRLNDNE